MPNGVKYLGWAATAAALILYIVVLGVTMPHLSGLADGRAMFDMRPFGYDFATAQDLLTRLGKPGADYYENIQHRVEFAFPILFAIALIFWLIVAARRWQGHGLPLSSAGLAVMLLVAIIPNAADLGENAAVSALLAVGAKDITPQMVDVASTFTMAKYFFTAVALLILFILAVGPWVASLVYRKRS